MIFRIIVGKLELRWDDMVEGIDVYSVWCGMWGGMWGGD